MSEKINNPESNSQADSTPLQRRDFFRKAMKAGCSAAVVALVGAKKASAQQITTMMVGEEGGYPGRPPHFVKPSPGTDAATTLRVGEEGGRPSVTTHALGEEGGRPPYCGTGQATTYAIGEEGQPKPTTKAVGEEGQPKPTTRAVGEEGTPPVGTSYATGEEGPPQLTTRALGEEGNPPAPTTKRVGEESVKPPKHTPRPTTLMVGEEGSPWGQPGNVRQPNPNASPWKGFQRW